MAPWTKGREPWTLTDLFTAARLAGADVTWIVRARLLRTHASLSDEAWRALWPRLLAGGAPEPEAGMEEEAAVFARIGSNAAALAGCRSASGSALLAADPHRRQRPTPRSASSSRPPLG
jgi:penicillin amidase